MNLETFLKRIEGTNDAYAEEGKYLGVNYIGEFRIIQFIDMETDVKVTNFIIDDWKQFVKQSVANYNNDGGDAEYEGIENTILHMREVEGMGNCVRKLGL